MKTEKLVTLTVFYKMLSINRTFVTNWQQCETAIDESEGLRLNWREYINIFFRLLIYILHEYTLKRCSYFIN